MDDTSIYQRVEMNRGAAASLLKRIYDLRANDRR